MSKYLKATIIFNAEKEIEFADLDALDRGIVDTLQGIFPGYSGACITISAVDEDGEPMGGRLHHHTEPKF